MAKLLWLTSLFLSFSLSVYAEGEICEEKSDLANLEEDLKSILETIKSPAGPSTIFPDLKEAIDAQVNFKTPVKHIETGDDQFPNFPSYSQCKKSFFRVATINPEVDQKITEEGWKSGWARKADILKKDGREMDSSLYDALPLSEPFEKRIIEYVRVKDRPSQFPKDSSVIGVLENPIRTLSVGYHTGYNNGMNGDHMRMDEIEVGECASAPECKTITPVDTQDLFNKKGLKPRYSVEGEWAVENHIPKSCVVATYRIKFGKVDNKCYSDANGNCNFK